MILKKETIEKLSKDLSLPYTGVEQDWYLEMANSNRITDFLNFYKQNNLTINEKIALMSLILSSYDDYLNEKNLLIDERWEEIKNNLESEKIIFVELIDYWASNKNSEKNNIFKITPLILFLK